MTTTIETAKRIVRRRRSQSGIAPFQMPLKSNFMRGQIIRRIRELVSTTWSLLRRIAISLELSNCLNPRESFKSLPGRAPKHLRFDTKLELKMTQIERAKHQAM